MHVLLVGCSARDGRLGCAPRVRPLPHRPDL